MPCVSTGKRNTFIYAKGFAKSTNALKVYNSRTYVRITSNTNFQEVEEEVETEVESEVDEEITDDEAMLEDQEN